jgi:hypothetical protein
MLAMGGHHLLVSPHNVGSPSQGEDGELGPGGWIEKGCEDIGSWRGGLSWYIGTGLVCARGLSMHGMCRAVATVNMYVMQLCLWDMRQHFSSCGSCTWCEGPFWGYVEDIRGVQCLAINVMYWLSWDRISRITGQV